MGWTPLAALLLGGVTYISSSGMIAKVLAELGRLNNKETPTIISILVLEDLAMAVYLPLVAVGLGIMTALTKLFVGWWAVRRAGVDRLGGLRAGAALVARGEFSIVIAGLGVSAGLEPQLGVLSAAYVLFLAILGPILARIIEPLSITLTKRRV